MCVSAGEGGGEYTCHTVSFKQRRRFVPKTQKLRLAVHVLAQRDPVSECEREYCYDKVLKAFDTSYLRTFRQKSTNRAP